MKIKTKKKVQGLAFNNNKNLKEKIRLGHVLTKVTKQFKYIT